MMHISIYLQYILQAVTSLSRLTRSVEPCAFQTFVVCAVVQCCLRLLFNIFTLFTTFQVVAKRISDKLKMFGGSTCVTDLLTAVQRLYLYLIHNRLKGA